MEFQIRPCRMEDAVGIQQLNARELGYDFPLSETTEKLRRALENGRDFIAVAACGNRIIGYIHAVDYDVLYGKSSAAGGGSLGHGERRSRNPPCLRLLPDRSA